MKTKTFRQTLGILCLLASVWFLALAGLEFTKSAVDSNMAISAFAVMFVSGVAALFDAAVLEKLDAILARLGDANPGAGSVRVQKPSFTGEGRER